MSAPKKVVLLSGPEEPDGGIMRFRLTYEGPLRATQGEPRNGQIEPQKRAAHKHDVRKVFHRQLKELWSTNLFLKDARSTVLRDPENPSLNGDERYVPLREALANNFQHNGYRFVPLVKEEFALLCSLDILFLRRDIPGSVISAGDIDNRLKTLIDALRMPRGASELAGETPTPDEEPFYCLLEDDKQVTRLSVETDTFLGASTADHAAVHLVITVDLRPYHVTWFNVAFS